MIRAQFLLAACLAATVLPQTVLTQDGVKSLLTASTQEASESSQSNSEPEQSEKTDPAEEERIQAEIAEIIAIRKRLGGGVSEQLKGFSIEMPGQPEAQAGDQGRTLNLEEAFAKQLAAASRNSIAVPAANGKGWDLVEKQAEPVEPAMQLQERRETVRHAARMLEEAAAILEEASEYDQADKVRQTAGELWRTARMRQ